MIRCPNCTAQLEFDAKQQKVKCEYCGTIFDPHELNIQVKKAKEIEPEEGYEGKSYTCSQCGATLLTFDETAITFCSYCGSQAMIESKMVKVNKPKLIIPFKKTKEDCIAAYKKAINKSIFIPNYMKSDLVLSKFRGIYIPYCIYKLSHNGQCVNKGSVSKGRRGDYIYYNDYTITADVDAEYDGVSYDMVSNLYDKFTTAIPHNYKEAEPFNPNYLAGFYADTANIDTSIYEDDAKELVNSDASDRLYENNAYSKFGCDNPQIFLNVVEKKVGMFPLYFLAVRDKSNTYVNYAIVNGQTGKVAIDIPVSFFKYVIASLILTIPIFFLINYKLVVLPKEICFLSIVSAVITCIISSVQISKIKKRETHADDEGYINANKTTEQTKKTSKFKYVIKQIIAIVLGVFIVIINPVADHYYYGASIIIFLLVIWSFYDLVREHNLLVSTKLPQLEKRGGSENE